jgi:formylglycine-generating enzyme
MRAPRLCLSGLLALLIASSASAVTMDWVPVGNPGNADELIFIPPTTLGFFGAVAYGYQIAKYEVTNAQYSELLNAKAASDPLGLYNTSMGSGFGGITRSGVTGSFTYSAIAGRESMPVNFVSFWDALRFANWMNNGQGSGDTETGAYTITAQGINDNSITRNPGAEIFLPSEDEWYKAAYHNAIGLSATDYFDYPAGTDVQTVCAAPGATPNTANCFSVVGDLTDVGSYTGSASPYGTFDQGGNVDEWNEAIIPPGTDPALRGTRGGNVFVGPANLAAAHRGNMGPDISFENAGLGFRLAMVPEPGTGLLLVAGLLGLAGWRRARE